MHLFLTEMLVVVAPYIAIVLIGIKPAILGAILVIATPLIAVYQNTLGIPRAKYDVLSFVSGILLIIASYHAK